jgi:hypothetical protein
MTRHEREAESAPRVWADESRAARRREARTPLLGRMRVSWYMRRAPSHDGIPPARHGRPDVLPIIHQRQANAAQCAHAAGAGVVWHGVGIAEAEVSRAERRGDRAARRLAYLSPWVGSERRRDGRCEAADRDPASGTCVLINGPNRSGPLTLSGGVVMP